MAGTRFSQTPVSAGGKCSNVKNVSGHFWNISCILFCNVSEKMRKNEKKKMFNGSLLIGMNFSIGITLNVSYTEKDRKYVHMDVQHLIAFMQNDSIAIKSIICEYFTRE